MDLSLPRRILLVSYGPRPPLAEALAAAWERLGVETKIFHSWRCNTWFDRLVIHPVNHWAHNLRLAPKSHDLFAGHPKSHKEWRSRELVRICREFRPDLAIITGVQRFKEEALKELHDRARVFFWFTESEQRFAEVRAELPHYHQVYAMSSASLEQARAGGAPEARLLLHAVDRSLFRPLELPKTWDWSFVGQWHERRQKYAEGLAEVSKHFVIYGTRWRKHNLLNPVILRRIRGTGIWGEDLVRLYDRSRVVVNISVWGDEARGGSGVNMRLLEVPACRACLLTDYSRDAGRLLEADREFVSADSLSDMQAKLAALLADRDRRRRIAQAGYEKTAGIRSYDDLVAQLCRDWAALSGPAGDRA